MTPDETPVDLPRISKVEYPTRVGSEERRAAVIWFENDTALRYVWNEERGQIQEQTYLGGVVYSSHDVGGSEAEIADYALLSVSEYINELREDPEACRFDWGHIYDMLVEGGR